MQLVYHPQPPQDGGASDLSQCHVPPRGAGRSTFTPFALGGIYITPGAMAQLSNSDITTALDRHARGDWGDIDEHDRLANDESLRTGCRLLSAYHTGKGSKFWIITEASRETTTVLLPEEY